MPNQKSPQILFKWQVPADKVYRVGPGLLFTTIQSAINQAVLDGVANGQQAVVEIYPQEIPFGNVYSENLTLAPNVYLRASPSLPSGTLLNISGSHTLTFASSGETFLCEGIYFESPFLGNAMSISNAAGVGSTIAQFENGSFDDGALTSGKMILVDNSLGVGSLTFNLINTSVNHNSPDKAIEIIGDVKGSISFTSQVSSTARPYNLTSTQDDFLVMSGSSSANLELTNCSINAGSFLALDITDSVIFLNNCSLVSTGSVGTLGGTAVANFASSNVSGGVGCFVLSGSSLVNAKESTFFGSGLPVVTLSNSSSWICDYCSVSTGNATPVLVNDNASFTARFSVVQNNSIFNPLIQINSAGASVFLRKNRLRAANTSTVARLIESAFSGTVTLEDNSYQNFRSGSGIINLSDIAPALNVSIFSLRERFERKGGQAIAYMADNGFPTIQEAINYLAARKPTLSGQGINSYVVEIASGLYTQNFSVDLNNFSGANFVVQGQTKLDMRITGSSTRINGSATITNSGASFGECNLIDLEIVATNGNRAINANCASVGGTHLKLLNARIRKNDVDGVSLITSNLTNGILYIRNSFLERSNDVSGVAIDHALGKIDAQDSSFSLQTTQDGLGQVTLSSTFLPYRSPPASVSSSANSASFIGCDFFLIAGRSFEMRANCEALFLVNQPLIWKTNVGELFYFAGANSKVSFADNYNFQNPAVLRASLYARDGTQATQIFTVTGNVYPGGSGININGVNFINGIDFAVGGTSSITAQNIVNAINNSGAAGVQGVSAVLNGLNIEIWSVSATAAANAITTAIVGAPPITVGGATLAGGANGVGGSFSYGTLNFVNGNSRAQNTLTVQNMAAAFTLV